MKLQFATSLSKVAQAVAVAAVMTTTAHGADLTGRVTRVIDGDTIEILAGPSPTRVRLAAIDAPERKCGQAFGEASRRSLADLVAGKTVTVIDQGGDRYGRTLGFVFVGRLNVNAEQVRRGMAWHYRAYSADQALAGLERQARASHRGLWADDRAVPPWDWRHGPSC